MDAPKRMEDSHPEPFPKDFGERLERLRELAGLSRGEFAERLGVDGDRVMEWRKGSIPPGERCGASCVRRRRFPGGSRRCLLRPPRTTEKRSSDAAR